jgi:hypothetical protein
MGRPVCREAIASLVFAVLGWTVLPLLGAILALVYAGKARRRLIFDDTVTGVELAGAARTVALAWLVLAAVGATLFVFFVAVLFAAGS